MKEVTSLADTAYRIDSYPLERQLQACTTAIMALIKESMPILHRQIRLDLASSSTHRDRPNDISELDPVVKLCRGYYTNFVSVVLELYTEGQSVRLKTDRSAKVSCCTR